MVREVAVVSEGLDRRTTSRWPRWLPFVAGLLAVLLVVAVVVASTTARGGSDPAGAGSGGLRGVANGPADEGWRWVSYRDVEVQVPEEWGYGQAPGPDWCAGARPAAGPYVDLESGLEVVMSIGCLRDRPDDLDVTHLTLSARQPDRSEERAGWEVESREVGAAVVSVWFRPADAAVARRIVRSAVVVDVDHHGCASTSPIQQDRFVSPSDPQDVAAVADVDSISVCQYAIGEPGVPRLLASRRLVGAAADRELAALKAAPEGGGPDSPDNCLADDHGDSAVVAVLRSGEVSHEVFVRHQSCRGNGFDDGVAERELTLEACAPLFAPPVEVLSGHGGAFGRCAGS